MRKGLSLKPTDNKLLKSNHKYLVKKVHAVVMLKKGMNLSAEELIEFCKQRLARYKAPKSVEFVDALPKNPAGKVLKRELREKYWAGLERRI
jgi:acyl-CoA synthetase (AMP-forming)/AMP-acid ligase II